jgi:hypothetical protein
MSAMIAGARAARSPFPVDLKRVAEQRPDDQRKIDGQISSPKGASLIELQSWGFASALSDPACEVRSAASHREGVEAEERPGGWYS